MGVEHCAVFSYGLEINRHVERELLRNYLVHLGRSNEWVNFENSEYLYELCELLNEQCQKNGLTGIEFHYVSEAYERDVDPYLFFNDLGISAGEKFSGCEELDSHFIDPGTDNVHFIVRDDHRNAIGEFFTGTKYIEEAAKTIPREVESWKLWCSSVQTEEGFNQKVQEMIDNIPKEFSWNLYRYMG